jgi:hypothetical protein
MECSSLQGNPLSGNAIKGFQCSDIIPVGNGLIVVGFSGTLVLGSGSGMMGRSSSFGIVGAKITSNIMVHKTLKIHNDLSKYAAELANLKTHTHHYLVTRISCRHYVAFTV